MIEALSRYRSPNAEEPAPEEFSAGFSAVRIEDHIASDRFRYFVAVASQELVGVIGVSDGRRVQHFFVAENLHGQGLGRALWERAKPQILDCMAVGEERIIEVRSSVYAVPVYEKFGFNVCGDTVAGAGVTYVPMRATLRKAGQ